MTDTWCFTCDHEIKPVLFSLAGGYVHIDEDDEQNCPCTEDDLECQP